MEVKPMSPAELKILRAYIWYFTGLTLTDFQKVNDDTQKRVFTAMVNDLNEYYNERKAGESAE